MKIELWDEYWNRVQLGEGVSLQGQLTAPLVEREYCNYRLTTELSCEDEVGTSLSLMPDNHIEVGRMWLENGMIRSANTELIPRKREGCRCGKHS